MMFKKCVGLVLAFAAFTFLVSIKSAEAQDGGPPCPAETCAVRCHSVGHVYDELSGSEMHEIHCSSCHLMGRIQEEQGLLDENEEEGFHILGYVTFSQGTSCEPEGHRIYDRKQLCVRCHEDNAHHVKDNKDCCDCHMKIDGLTTYRVHVYPDPGPWFPVEPDFTGPPPESIFKFVTREHRSHTFKAKPR